MGLAPGPVWLDVENNAPTRIWSLDRPVHTKLMYQLCYPVPPYVYAEPENSPLPFPIHISEPYLSVLYNLCTVAEKASLHNLRINQISVFRLHEHLCWGDYKCSAIIWHISPTVFLIINTLFSVLESFEAGSGEAFLLLVLWVWTTYNCTVSACYGICTRSRYPSYSWDWQC